MIASIFEKIKDILPGLALVLAFAIAARILHGLLPDQVRAVFGLVTMGLLFGLLAGNFLPLPQTTVSGIKFSYNILLRTAIILLGARFSLMQVAAIGGKALLLIIVLICLALFVAHFLGRKAGISGRLATLIGVGTAICGNTAITVTAPVIKAKDEEVAFAIATNTLLGTCAVFFYPILGRAIGLDDVFFGTWVGVAVNDTSQVVATGFSFSERAGELATMVKLTRNALMGFVIVAIGFFYSHGQPDWGDISVYSKIKKSVPLFVFGFLGMAVLNTLGFFDAATQATGIAVVDKFTVIAKFLILMALVGVGLNTRASTMKAIGPRPFLIGLTAAAVSAIVSFIAISLFFV